MTDGIENRKRASTIIDVAEKAGVAVGTVSRFLNGESVRAANRNQIERAISDLNYRRNLTAAAMKTDITHIVGFMAPSLSEFHAGLLDRFTRHMRRYGRAVLTFLHDEQPGSIREGLEFFASHRVDAVVMQGLAERRSDILDYVDKGLRIVFFNNDVDGVAADRVMVDNRDASRRAVGHLLELGHRRIGIVVGKMNESSAVDRFQGYRDALEAYGLAEDEDIIGCGEWDESGSYGVVAKFLALDSPPTAIFSCNYNMALGALSCLHQNGVRLPDDMSLVSFDDVAALRLHQPGITSVAQPIDKIAEAIATVIETRMQDPKQPGKRLILLGCDIILRGSAQRPR